MINHLFVYSTINKNKINTKENMKKTNNIISDWLNKYGDPEIDKLVEKQIEMGEKSPLVDLSNEKPCNSDHNGECLICDCWLSDCAYDRWLKEDYRYETKEELDKMFKK